MNLKGKWTADLGNGYYKNPIIYADYSDPDVIRVGEDFYMTASSFVNLPGLPILHSKDLVNWELINHAVERLQPEYDTVKHGCGVWAPSIRYHDGKFYIYYADPDLGIMMTCTDDIYGEWSPVMCVMKSCGIIDTCPFWDDDGRAYIVHGYAKSRCGIKSKIGLLEMTPDGKSVISEDKIIFDGTISHPTIEGPKAYKRNGWYYIMAPAGGVPTGWQTVLRSRNINGPYEDRIVLRQGLTDINGPHQGGWVELESGESWFIHFQDVEVAGRLIHLQPVEWVNDWPVMGENVDSGMCGQPVKVYKKPNVGREYPISFIPTSDDFSGEKLGLQWSWQANPRPEWYSLTANPGHLRLYAAGDDTMWNLPNVLSQLWQAPSMVTTVRVEIPKGVGKNKAALGVIGLEYGYIALSDDGVIKFVRGTAISSNHPDAPPAGETIVTDRNVNTGSAYLRTEVISKCGGYTAVVKCSYSLDGEHYFCIGRFDAMQGKWVGAKHALFVTGKDGAYADFSDFKVE